MIRCTGTKSAVCCSSEQSFYHSGCSTRCILPSHFHSGWDTVWSVRRFTCRFPDSCTLKTECWIEIFHSVLSLPSSICFSWLTNSVCATLSCGSHPKFRHVEGSVWWSAQRVCAGFWKLHAGSCQALSIFKIRAHSWVLSHVWPGIPLKSGPDFSA